KAGSLGDRSRPSCFGEIRDRRLYRVSHDTFETYCREKWNMERAQAYRLMDSAGVVKNLSPMGDKPTSERQARPLTRLPAERQPEAWRHEKARRPRGRTGWKEKRAGRQFPA